MFCNNCGAAVPDRARFCGQCGAAVGTVLPDAPPGTAGPSASGLIVDPREFEHPSMQGMNQVLRNSVVLRRSAESLSRKIGKPWYESTFNCVPATETQYARVHRLAGLAARRLGVTRPPAVYVELDRVYDSATYGTEDDAFVNVGSYLPRVLNDRELLFILGHEMGHLVSKHALWTTAILFLVGQQRSNLMSEGVMGFLSNPLKIIEGGVDSMVTGWQRVAEFTADRAALLVVGSFDAAKRAIFLLHLRSRRELDEMNIDEWIGRVESQDQTMAKYSQMMTSATPYLSSRLVELKRFAGSPQYEALRARIESRSGVSLDGLFDERGYLAKPKAPAPPKPPARLPVSPGSGPAPPGSAAPRPPRAPAGKVRLLEGRCPRCGAGFAFRLLARPAKAHEDIRCRSCGRTFRLKLDGVL
jgi:Zn-dependent protease with chaperone function